MRVTWTAFAILALFIASIFIHLNLNVSFSVCSWNYLNYNRKHKFMAIDMLAEKIKEQIGRIFYFPPSINFGVQPLKFGAKKAKSVCDIVRVTKILLFFGLPNK